MFRPATRISWAQHKRTVVFLAGASLAVSAPFFTHKVQNDALVDPDVAPIKRTAVERLAKSDKELLDRLVAYSWGSGRSNSSISSSSTAVEGARVPTEAATFSGLALRDLVLDEALNALVDASGDVYYWETSSKAPPKCILKSKNIKTIAVSGRNIFALSNAGEIHSISTAVDSVADSKSRSWFSFLWHESDDSVLKTSSDLGRRETFASISAGRDHLLAVTSAGRTFAHPVSLNANSHGQLGTRKIRVLNATTVTPDSGSEKDGNTVLDLAPQSQVDPYAYSSPFARASGKGADGKSEPSQLVPLLYEIPSLRGIAVAKAVANDRSSYVLTKDHGRVLAWGANEYGQLGLGMAAVVPMVSVPAEVPLSRSYPSGSSVRCTDIAAGGNVAYFAVESSDVLGKAPSFDLLACGMGQYGALGNGSYVQAQGSPVKSKVISGNVMFNEKTNSLDAIRLHSLSASPTGHALASLSSGKDLLTWGANGLYQLGTGKRANISVPTYMRDFPLVSARLPDSVDNALDKQGRMSLRSGTVKVLRDMSGRKVGKNVSVEQWPVAGWNASAVYWRIVG